MSIRVTVEDLETGEVESRRIGDDDYFVMTTGSCRLEHIQRSQSGTVQLTIKGHAPKPVPERATAEGAP